MNSESFCFLEQTDFAWRFARCTRSGGPLRIEHLQEVSTGDSAALAETVRGVFSASDAAAVCALRPASQRFHLANADEARLHPGLAGIVKHLQPPGGETTNAAWIAAMDAASGSEPSAARWFVVASSADAYQQSQAALAALQLKSVRNVPATLATAGALVRTVSSPTILLEIGELQSQAILIDRTGVVATVSVRLNRDRIAEAVQTELGLKFRGSAGKLFFSPDYDFGDVAAKIASRIAEGLKPELKVLLEDRSKPTALYCPTLPAGQQWLASQLALALGLAPHVPDMKGWCAAAGIAFASPSLESGVSPAWFGFLHFIHSRVLAGSSPAPWQPEWRILGVAPAATPAATPPPAPTPPPPTPKPAPVGTASPASLPSTPAAAKPSPAPAVAPAAPKPAPQPSQPAAAPAAQKTQPPAINPKAAVVQGKKNPPLPVPANKPAAPANPPAAKPAPSSVSYPPKPAAAVTTPPPPAPAKSKPAPVAATSPGGSPAPRPARRKGPRNLLIGSVLVVAAALGFFLFQSQRNEAARIAAEKQATEQRLQAELERVRLAEQKAREEAEALKKAETDFAQKLALAESARQQAEEDARAQAAARLANARGTLVIATDPAGATVVVGDLPPRQSPATFANIKTGKYPVSITLLQHEDAKFDVEVRENATTEPATVALVRAVSTLEIASDPPGASYELRPANAFVVDPGVRRTGRTPATLDDLAPAAYAVTFAREGWTSHTETVTVARGQTARVVWQVPTGMVKLASDPSPATIRRAGTELGATPFVLNEQPPGPVEFELIREDYDQPVALTGRIEPGKTLELTARFSPEDRIYRAGEFDTKPDPTNDKLPALPYYLTLEKNRIEIELTVGRDGTPRNFKVVQSTHPDLGKLCIDAMAKWKFKPALLRGKPVNARITVPLAF